MVDRGPLFRRALSWLPAQFASQSDAPVGAPRRFGSTEHLSTEAIAAYVDGELRMKSYLRAAHHLSLCPQCAAEVDGQSQARTALRDSRPITTPARCSTCWRRSRKRPPKSRPHRRPPSVTSWLMARHLPAQAPVRWMPIRAATCSDR